MKTLAAICLTIILTGCSQSFGTKGCTTPAVKVYPIQGKVISVDNNPPSIQLAHEDIPGLMPAMTMDFNVSSGVTLDNLKPGDQVNGDLQITDGDSMIIKLEKQ